MADDNKSEDISLQQQLNDLIEKAGNDANKLAEIQKKLNALKREELVELQKSTSTHQRIRDMAAGTLETQKKSIDYNRQRAAQAADYLKQLERMKDFDGKRELQAEAQRDLLDKQLDIVDDQIDQLRLKGELNSEEGKQLLKNRDELQKSRDVLQQNKQLLGKANQTTLQLTSGFGKLNELGSTLAAKMSEEGGLSAGLYGMTLALNKATGMAKNFASQITGGMELSVTGLITKMLEMGLEFDKTIKQFERSTQLGDEFSESMQLTAERTAEFGVSMEEASKAHMDLIQNTTVFTLAGEQQRQMLADTAAVMAELGVSTADFAKGIENSMKYFGRSMAEAEEVQRELLAVAQELKVLPGELTAQFGKMGPAMAKFGDQGVEVFKELAGVAKQTGMEMEKILSITDQFDTFEGAAEATGKLNAALGGNFVNAMDMMMNTDPAARFESLRDAISSAGLSFDSMSYYQKQFFAQSLGLNSVGDLALMMSGNLDAAGGAAEMTAAEYEEMAEQAQIVQSVQEKFQATIAKFFMENKDQIMAMIDGLSEFMQMLLENADKIKFWIKMLISAKVAITGMTFVMALMRTATAQQIAQQQAQILSNSQLAVSEAVKTNAMLAGEPVKAGVIGSNTALAGSNTAVGTSAKFAALGVGALMLGLIAFAVLGLMMESPSKLVLAVVALAGGIYLVGQASALNTAQIQALGVATKQAGIGLLGMGAGIFLMAAGFGLLDISQMLGLLGFLYALEATLPIITAELTALAPVLASNVFQIMGVAAAMALLAAAVSLIPLTTIIGLIGAAWGFVAAAAPLAAAITAVGDAVIASSPGWAIIAGTLAIVAVIAVAVGVAIVAIFSAMEAMPATKIFAMALGFFALSMAFNTLSMAVTALGVGGVAAAPGIIAVTMALKPLLTTITILVVAVAAGALAFAAMFSQLTAERIGMFVEFIKALTMAAPALLGMGPAFAGMGIGMAAFGMGLAMTSQAKLASLGQFFEGLGNVDFSALNGFGDSMDSLASGAATLEGLRLGDTLYEISDAVGSLSMPHLTRLNDTLHQMATLSTDGLDRLAEAIRGIAEAMNSVPTIKTIAFTSVLASAAVAAVAIRVLQAGTGGGGGQGAGFFGGAPGAQAQSSKKGKAEYTLEIKLDSDLFEERVIEIASEESGRQIRESIRNER